MALVLNAAHRFEAVASPVTEAERDRFLTGDREWMYRLALSITGNAATAEDATQEALMRCWLRRGTLARADNPRAWIRKVLVRRAISQTSRPTEQLDFEKEVPGHERAQLVASVLRSLPADSRAVLALVEMEGLDYREAGEALGIPAGTVGSRLSRAKELFRAAWEGR